MAVYKDKKRDPWYVSLYYTDWTGKQQRKLKRGFSTKKEAQDWERHFSLEKASSLDMTFALVEKYRDDKTTEWAATRSGSHDIECTTESVEVKSTIKRYGATITISGQHQLEHVKPLWLYFCRMEESLEGFSINDAKDILVANGYDENKLEIELERQGFEKGANIRN